MTRHRPHQRPLLTRFAFVQPTRWLYNVGPIPCEREDAECFVVWEWEATAVESEDSSERVGAWIKGPVYQGDDMNVAYERARDWATQRDGEIAMEHGVEDGR
jgi:hypothetical protein